MPRAVRFKRLVYLIHRWSGVVGCILMLLWLGSGLVMLYVGYPRLLPAERLAALPALDTPRCCVPVEQALQRSQRPDQVRQVTLTSVAGQPRYILREGGGGLIAVDAMTGYRVPPVDSRGALASARAFMGGTDATLMGTVLDDRWTHSGALDPHRPLYRVEIHDAASTLLYISSATGEVVMDAPLAQRGWNFVGAWLHWLYMFRDGSKDVVWSWTVIVLSAAGTVLALTGALAGIWRWRFSGKYKSGSRSPYRDTAMRWHHIVGLAFGGLVLTWVFSGLMSMNPVGIFDAKQRPDMDAYRQGLPGAIRPALSTSQALLHLKQKGFETRELEWRVLHGQGYLLARDARGMTRLVAKAPAGGYEVMERWPRETLQAAGAHLISQGIESAQLLTRHDAFYYQRGEASMYAAAERRLPVLRIDFRDAGQTMAYLDPYTGDVVLSLDRSQRTGRWLFNLLHSWDLPAFLRFDTARDVVLTLCSLGGAILAITGCIIGYRRLRINAHAHARRSPLIGAGKQ
jgi:hypothetical protein